MPDGDIDFNGSLIAPVIMVPNKISGNYKFTMNLRGVSIAEVTEFKEDGTYSVIRNSGYDHNVRISTDATEPKWYEYCTKSLVAFSETTNTTKTIE